MYDEWPNFLGNRPMAEALLSRLRFFLSASLFVMCPTEPTISV